MTMSYTTNDPTVTPPAADPEPGLPWQRVLLGVVLSVLVVVTVVGNGLVLVAVARYKRLQTVFNAFIVNLAVTDVAVAITVMSFFAIYSVLQRWPFSEVMCGVWMLFDFGMTFCSVFTLVAISVDRYWSVHWSHHYRLHNNWRKAVIFIAVVWVAMLVIWVPAYAVDRVHNSREGECFYDPEKNKAFVIFAAIFGYHGTTIVMLYCYIKVFLFIRRRSKTGPLSRSGLNRQVSSAVNNTAAASSATLTGSASSPHDVTANDVSGPDVSKFRAPEGTMKETDEGSTGGDNDKASSTGTVDTANCAVQDPTCPKESCPVNVVAGQISACPKPCSVTVVAGQISACPKEPCPVTVVAGQISACPKEPCPVTVVAGQISACPKEPCPVTVVVGQISACPKESCPVTVGAGQISACPKESYQPAVGAVQDCACPAAALQQTDGSEASRNICVNTSQVKCTQSHSATAQPCSTTLSQAGFSATTSQQENSSAMPQPQTSADMRQPQTSADMPQPQTSAAIPQPQTNAAKPQPTPNAVIPSLGSINSPHSESCNPGKSGKGAEDTCTSRAFFETKGKDRSVPTSKNKHHGHVFTEAVGTNHCRLASSRKPVTADGEKTANQQTNQQTSFEHSSRRERKTFVTLTYIIVGYLVCWTPFHVAFDLMAIDNSLVPVWLYDLTYWLTYCNSTINPFLYNFGNPEFRTAFREILCCKKTSRQR